MSAPEAKSKPPRPTLKRVARATNSRGRPLSTGRFATRDALAERAAALRRSGMSVRDICGACHISPATLYRMWRTTGGIIEKGGGDEHS